MKRFAQFVLAAAVVAVAVSPAMAQRQRQQGQRQQGQGGAGFGQGQLFLLSQKSVQEELKLSEDQVAKVKELAEKQRGTARDQADLSREDRQKKRAEQAKANEK